MPAYHGRHRTLSRPARARTAALTVSAAVLALATGSSAGAQAAQGSPASDVVQLSGASTPSNSSGAPGSSGSSGSSASAGSSASEPKAKPTAKTGSASRQVRASKAVSRSAARPKALGPRQTLARTPTARSAKTTRVAAQAFPDLTKFTWTGPVHGTRQTSGFGQRWGRMHAGLDFGGPVGTRLKAMSGGVVTYAGHQGGYGNKVEIQHWDGSLVCYGHMASTSVKKGQVVMPGQLIGRLGNSGRSTGPHLHLEVRPGGGDPVDPWPWLVERGILPADTPRS